MHLSCRGCVPAPLPSVCVHVCPCSCLRARLHGDLLQLSHTPPLERLLQRLLEGASTALLETFFNPSDGGVVSGSVIGAASTLGHRETAELFR
jgi:hypothetical protein